MKQIIQEQVNLASKCSRIRHELRIRGYTLLEPIGEGAYAKVWRGTRIFNKTHELAIKIICKKKGDSELVEKFLPRELELLRQVHHPYFVKMHDVFEAGDRVFVIMDLAKCGSLEQIVLFHGAMSPKYCRRVLGQLCSVVKYLHNKNIAHRDLKSSNVLVDEEGNIKLTDLGFSRRCPRLRSGVRMLAETFCGSFSYCAPEVICQKPYCPKRADIWSLGCIFYELATGILPFDSTNATILRQQETKQFSKIPDKISRFIDNKQKDLISRMLEPNPEKRISLVEILSHPWMQEFDAGGIECPVQQLLDVEDASKQQQGETAMAGDPNSAGVTIPNEATDATKNNKITTEK